MNKIKSKTLMSYCTQSFNCIAHNTVVMKIAEQVDKGEIELKVFLGTREISDKPYDLCHNLPAVNLSCPLHPGNRTIM